MAISSAGDVPADATVSADVCVVGAGPAGLAVALRLSERGCQVLLLESGNLGVDRAAADLSVLDDAGPPRHRNGPSRDRRFGGTAWYGRIVTLDPVDFEPRAWVPHSGWPIAAAALDAYIGDAAAFLGFAIPDALASSFWRREAACRLLDGGGLAPRVHLIARRKDLGRRHRTATRTSSRVHALLRATVVGLDLDPETRRAIGLRVAGPDGRSFRARGGRYVLACGALENAQLLLAAMEEHPHVFDPSGWAIGRFLMDHARVDGVARLRLNPRHASYVPLFRRLTEGPARKSRSRLMIAAGLSDEMQRREALLNAAGFFYPENAAALSVRQQFHAAFSRLGRRPSPGRALVMVEQLEQRPDPASRVTLGHERDRLGRRRLRMDWRVGTDTLHTHRRFHRLLADRLAHVDAGTLESRLLDDASCVPAYGDAAHPMGTTRMSSSPAAGVVDANLRLHAIDNLYVVGSSVFPTGGHANPTLTVVALALRLAGHLGGNLPG
jgi:choline dehydrogenase-like flavoprotein